MQKIEMYCVTDKELQYLNELNYNLSAVGKNIFSNKYLRCDNKDNIYHKEKNYSELTFHYWYWKNLLKFSKNEWIGFCQKRRFWIKQSSSLNNINSKNLKDHILTHVPKNLESYDSIICKSISVFLILDRSIIRPPSHVDFPEMLCPPLRTAVSKF